MLGGTDGSCVSPRHPLLARSGSGVYFFEGHPCNHWDHSPGFPQTAQRGEVFALLLLLQLAFANTVAVVDSAYACACFDVVVACQGVLGSTVFRWAHSDLWVSIADHVRLSPFLFQVVWTKGHATAKDVETGKVRADFNQLNHGADGMAGQGRRLLSPSAPVEAAAQFRVTAARSVQAMLATVLALRQKTLPTETFAAHFSAEQVRIRADWLADLATNQDPVCLSFLQDILQADLALPGDYKQAIRDSLRLSNLNITVNNVYNLQNNQGAT